MDMNKESVAMIPLQFLKFYLKTNEIFFKNYDMYLNINDLLLPT